MDSNDPTNTNSNPSGVISATPMEPATNAGVSPSPWDQPSTPMPDTSVPTPVESLPGAAPTGQIISDTAIAPTAMPPASSWDQPATAPVAASPWDAQPPQPMATIDSSPAYPSSGVAATPAEPTANLPPESPWGASTPSVATSDVPVAPQAPAESQVPDASAASNPFLQPNAGTAFTLPQSPFDQPQTQAPLPDPGMAAAAPPSAMAPNPFASVAPDPLNTAFAPTGVPAENPFATSQATPPTPDTDVTPAAADMPVGGAIPGAPPPAPANPWDLPPIPPGGVNPAPGTAQPPATGENPILNLGQPQPAGTNEDYQGAGQSIPNNPQTGPLDLSSLQNPPTPAPAEQSVQPGNPLPETGPVENAPTDLSHLIAGEEPASQIPGVYTPPVAADQNPAVSPVQTPIAEGETPPPGKHLNLTKVLLVAGIPIILIVAALSAYLILGVGQQAQPKDQTSLPVEQTQAPLTNPPQQIVAPSPAIIPEPSATLPQSSILPTASLSPSPSAAASLSPAMQAAQRKASPSPSSAATGSPSPASSASTSLPVN